MSIPFRPFVTDIGFNAGYEYAHGDPCPRRGLPGAERIRRVEPPERFQKGDDDGGQGLRAARKPMLGLLSDSPTRVRNDARA